MQKKLAVIVTALLLMTAAGAPAVAGVIDIRIKGIPSGEGRMFVGLFRPGDDFPRQKHAYRGVVSMIANQETAARFTDVPDGTYAVAVYHDANRNGELDRGLFGIPKEDYGFSNNARGSFGPPEFKEAAFAHDGTTKITIDLTPPEK